MPNSQPAYAISIDEAINRIGRQAFGEIPSAHEDAKIGLEQEFFPVAMDGAGRPQSRLALAGEDGSVAFLDDLAARNGLLRSAHVQPYGPWRFELSNGGQITFEPGGQIEHSTTVHDSVRQALDDLSRMQTDLGRAMAKDRRVLAASGADLWHPLEALPLQLPGGRYLAMAEYFDQRGSWGRLMMRHSASLQINLDLGPDEIWQERWALANLLVPVILASFAASPGLDTVSQRGMAWQALDHTRTGFPQRLLTDPSADPKLQWAEAALDADVLLFRPQPGQWRRGEPNFSFGAWIRNGHPELGWPTMSDLDYHLTTLFFEVRPRGFLELRSCDSLPSRWRPAPVVLVSALLYDEQARHSALAMLEVVRHRLPELWRRAASKGVRDPELGTLAAAIWEIALAGASRLSLDYVGADYLAMTREYLDRFTFSGRMPADELCEMAGDPGRSLAWAADCEETLGASAASAPSLCDVESSTASGVCCSA
ncbi:MAG: hypothetical protein GY906_33515 [bacterium]|nr:hypothetical protein [bacterium]